MALVVRVARYSGGGLPQPARLHAVLRASSCTNEHDRLLRWWESLAPPEVHSGISASTEGFAFVWPDIDPDAEQLRAVRDLVQRVPLGNIPEWREWSVLSSAPSNGAWTRYIPSDESADTTVRIAASGFSEALETVRDQGYVKWESVATVQSYRKSEVQRPVPSGHGEMLSFRFPRGVAVDGVECGAAAARLRDAVLARVPDPLPPEVSGHGVNGKPHVAYVPLLAAGERRSRGDLIGVAVVFPRDAGDWATSVKSSLVDGPRPLWLPIGPVRMDLVHTDGHETVKQARPEHWAGPARTWVTATPMVLDRFSGRGGEANEIARSCARIGLPQPSTVEVSRDPLIRGGAKLRPRDLPRSDKRPYTHARVEFPTAVTGPVLLGAQRHVGMGLCQPEVH